jgi:hypothetical protein
VTAAMLGVNAGIACANIFFPKLAAFFAQYSNDKGYFMAALVMMLVGLPLMLNGFMQIKERVPPSPEKVTIRDTFHNLRQNKPLFIVLLSFFFCVFHNVAGGLYIYFFINNLGDGSLQMAIGVMGIVAAVLCLVAPMLTRRMQKRKLFMILCGLDVAVRVVMWFVGYQQVTMLFILLGLSTLFVMMTNILTSSMIADTIEYAEYHTHKRCAAITFSGQTFTGKMSVAVGGGLIGVFLTMIGYVPQAQIQSEGVLSGLFFGICLLPAIGSLIRMGFMSRFTFTEEKHAEICRLLAERNASAKAPGGCALPGLHQRRPDKRHQIYSDFTNASRSSLSWSWWVSAKPCGALSYTFSVAFLIISAASLPVLSNGTIWSLLPWITSVGTSIFAISGRKSVSPNAVTQSMVPFRDASRAMFSVWVRAPAKRSVRRWCRRTGWRSR